MPLSSAKILLTDANIANRLISLKSLERSGYSVTAAKNGSHALSLAKLAIYDLILMDIMMPVMDGVKALRKLRREDGPNQNTPAFALTAFCSPQDRQRYLLVGFDAVLSKPLRSGDLETVFAQCKNKTPFPLGKRISETSFNAESLLDWNVITELHETSDLAALQASQSRFWTSVRRQCEIIEKSLPDALRGDGPSLSKFRRAVHTVKGVSAANGLGRVAKISTRLQNAPPLEIPGLVKVFIDALKESQLALTEALA